MYNFKVVIFNFQEGVTMLTTLIIALAVICVFVASILFFPSLIIRKHTIKVYSLIPVLGAVILIMCGRVDFLGVVNAFSENI